MEDLNMLAADCIVISCCCQCLVLQIVVLLLLKLPRKLVRKTKEFAKRKRRRREKREQMVERDVVHYNDEFIGIDNGRCIRIQGDGLSIESGLSCGCCMEEIEKVMEDLHQKGEFAFGSFWGKSNSGSSPSYIDEEECKGGIVQYQLIEVINCT